MKLPFSLKFDKKKPELFLVLVLRDEKVNAVVFEEQIGKANILGEQEEYFQDSIDRITDNQRVEINCFASLWENRGLVIYAMGRQRNSINYAMGRQSL